MKWEAYITDYILMNKIFYKSDLKISLLQVKLENIGECDDSFDFFIVV